MLLACAANPATLMAFPTECYAKNSVLAQGRWMKVSVDADGIYMIPTSTLRSWGFSDLSKVRVYGYGGRRLPDVLDKDTYTDDLPEVQSRLTDRGLVFYALGAGEWDYVSVPSVGKHLYYRQNDYSSVGHYFVTEAGDGTEPRTFGKTGTPGANSPYEIFTDCAHHELERVPVPGEAGPDLLGEDMRYTRSRTITIPAPGYLEHHGDHESASFVCSFVSALSGGSGVLSFTNGNTPLQSATSDRVNATSASSYVHGTETLTMHGIGSPDSRGNYNIGISFQTSAQCTGAWLNYISVTYPRKIDLGTQNYLNFGTSANQVALSGVRNGITVWDVTDPTNIKDVDVELSSDGKAQWTAEPGEKRYAAWNSGASLPTPRALGSVTNQNLHADRDYDMVIVAPSQFTEHANRLATLHENSADTLTVKVVTPEQIYNEFSSGSVDAGALRRYFKMLYDRGNSGDGRPLRYAVLMARTTLDNRGLSTTAPSNPTIPSWMAKGIRASLSDNDGFCSDDVTAMLADGSGSSLGTDKLSIALGRIPVVSTAEAKDVVDKAIQYHEGARKTSWKHRFMFLADDQDGGTHLKQTENMVAALEGTADNQHLVRKVYMDAYPFVGSNYPGAREAMFRYLDEGVVWWNFIGHANTTGWTAEQQLSYTDLNNMYLRHWPFIYAATCNFMRLDGSSISGGEILYKERFGGAIGIISAARPVYITDNGHLSNALGRALATRDDNGSLLPPGEIYRRAKNDIRDKDGKPLNNTNHLRYIFVGDPALRLAMPSNIVRLDHIGDTPVDGEQQPTMAALEKVPVSGSVTDPDGNVLENFNGTVMVDIFDAETTKVTLGHGENGTKDPFEDYGERVFCGSAEVKNGRFTINVAMPLELSQNFRPAAMSMYAFSNEDDTEAVGLNRGFYVYGINENAAPDDKAPVIEQLVLNHSTFSNGDVVNTSPMLIASVSDDVGINVSSAGIGHQMTATLDGTKTFTDLSFYYTPSADGSPAGVINYPFEELQPGNHTLTLRIWDTAGNSSSRSIDFFVRENLAPKIFDVYTDANPASTQANFYLSHDQPDNMLTVEITVYNLVGRPIWSGSATGRSDMFLTVPVTWDLTDTGGRRVGRGIYLYRASVTSDGTTFETASRRIAVTAR